MLISYYANKKSSPRLPSWQPSLIFFNVPIESRSIIKHCTLKLFQVTYICYIRLATGLVYIWVKAGSGDDLSPEITSLTIVYLTVYSGADQRKRQSSASLAFVRGIHRWPVNSPHKWPVTRKMFPFDDVIMKHIHTIIKILCDGRTCLNIMIIKYTNSYWSLILTSFPDANYFLKGHENLDQHGSYTTPSKTMPYYSYPASLVDQYLIPNDFSCQRAIYTF